MTVPRATDAGYPLDLIDIYRKAAVAEAKAQGDDKLAEKIGGGSFGGGLKYSYGHALYVLDLDERAKGLQLLTLSHSQFKDLDERKFKLWQKKLAKNPNHPCPVCSVHDAYPVEIEKKKERWQDRIPREHRQRKRHRRALEGGTFGPALSAPHSRHHLPLLALSGRGDRRVPQAVRCPLRYGHHGDGRNEGGHRNHHGRPPERGHQFLLVRQTHERQQGQPGGRSRHPSTTCSNGSTACRSRGWATAPSRDRNFAGLSAPTSSRKVSRSA